MKKLIVLLAVLGLFGACSKTETKIKSTPLSETNRVIDGVKISPNESISQNIGAHENFALTIQKGSFKQLFRMSSALIESIPNPTGHHLNEKVVYFKKNGNTVGLFELTSGRYETSALSTEVLLTTFPTLSETEDSIVIDFNKGMSKLFYTDSTYTSDFANGSDGEESVYSISDSFVDRVEIIGSVLYVDQLIRLNVIEKGKQTNSAMRLKYNFQSYSYDVLFPSKISSEMNKVGYFEVNPLIDPGSTERQVMIAKWNVEKPITFYLSSNTPEDLVQPLTDAVLYWNQAFKEALGKEPLRVEMLPEGVDLYTPGYNIIQWMDNDAAGAAYADIEADPLTGEIHRTNIYMPSIFATSGTNDGYERLLQMVANSGNKPAQKARLALKSFTSSRFMESYNVSERVAEVNAQISELIAQAKKDGKDIDVEAIVKRFRDDTVRETVAHEVGHCMGLRHNFAGSTQTNLTKTNLPSLGKMFFLSGNLNPGVKPGSSIMDYNAPIFAAMIGANIRLKGPALSYDAEAIRWGYTDAELSSIKAGAFCTDSHYQVGIYKDCKQFDQMKTAIEGSSYGLNEVLKSIPFMLANAYSDILSSDIADKTPYLKRVSLNPSNVSAYIMNSFAKIPEALAPTAQSIAFLTSFGQVSYYNKDKYFEANATLKRQGVASLGGLAQAVLSDFTPVLNTQGFTLPVVEKMKTTFTTNIENLFGQTLTADERAAITESSERFFKAITSELLTSHTLLMNKSTFFEIDENFPAALANHLDKILFTKGSEELLRSKDASKVIMKPLIDFVRSDADLRAQAVLMAAHNFFPTETSYELDMGNLVDSIWGKYGQEFSEIKNVLSEGTASRKSLNWITLEMKRFAPLKP